MDDVPLDMHDKLMSIHNRGRFSHLLPARVARLEDFRLVHVLDDDDDALPLGFAKVLGAFEISVMMQEEKKTVVSVASVATILGSGNQAVGSLRNQPSSGGFVNHASAGNQESAGNQQVTTGGLRPMNKYVIDHDDIGNFGTNGAGLSSAMNSPTKPPDYKTIGTIPLFQTLASSSSVSVSLDNASKKRTAASIADPPLLASESTPPKREKIGDLTMSSSFSSLPSSIQQTPNTPAGSLIHKWNPFLRSRCYAYPQRTLLASTSSSQAAVATSSSQGSNNQPIEGGEILFWIRHAVRVDLNFALYQCLWLRRELKVKVRGVAFVPPRDVLEISAHWRAYVASLLNFTSRLKRDFEIDVTILEELESRAAVPVFALWTREGSILPRAILTEEVFDSVGIKTTLAVSKSAGCVLFAFDLENVSPVRFAMLRLKSYAEEKCLQIVNENDFTLYKLVLASLEQQVLEKALTVAAVSLLAQMSPLTVLSIENDWPPEIIGKRWHILHGSDVLITRCSPDEIARWGESTSARLVDSRLTEMPRHIDMFLTEVRLGTLSPLRILNDQTREALSIREFRLFAIWRAEHHIPESSAAAAVSSPGLSQSSVVSSSLRSPLKQQPPCNGSSSSGTPILMPGDFERALSPDERWNQIQRDLIKTGVVKSDDFVHYLQGIREWSDDPLDTARALLKKHNVGIGSPDALVEVEELLKNT